MKNHIRYICFVLCICSASAQSDIENGIRAIFDSELKKHNVYNGLLKVYSKSKSINIQVSEGMFTNEESITIDNPFYTASIGKTFTATAIGLLRDKGEIAFNDKISQYLSKDILNGLHVIKNVESSHHITIAQLLQHTSGLPDYFEDHTIDGSPNIISQLFINPNKIWTPTDCIQFSKEHMNPLFLPGEGYHYTDTEYVLLGLIIESVSGLKLHEFYEHYFFQPLEMHHTYLNLKSEPIAKTPQMTEVFVGNLDISDYKSLSADWAGGGIVSTISDLITFQEALFTNKLVSDETLEKMQEWLPETKGMYYGFGLRNIIFNELDESLPHIEVIGHSGSTGTFLYYCPELDTYISGTLNQADEVRGSILFIVNILDLIENSN